MSILDDLLDTTAQIGAAGTALDGLTDSLGLFNSTASASAGALGGLREASGLFARASGEATKGAEGLAGAAKGAAPAVLNAGQAGGAAARGLDSLKSSAMGAVDRLKPAGGVLGAVTQALQALGPEGEAVAVILGIVVSVVTGLAQELWDLTRAAVAISQEKDALAETFGAITDGAKSGLDVVNELSDVATKLPFDEGKVLGWGKALAAAGKSGDALVQSVNAIAASAAIMKNNGEAALAFSKRLQTAADAGEKIKLDRRMQRMLAETGVRASELAAALGMPADKLSSMAIDAGKLGDAFEKALIQKGAGALDKMSLTWGSITGKLRDAWDDLFEDLGPAVQPLMRGIRDLFAEFSAGSTIQSGAKSAVTSFFTTLLGWATRATHALHVGFLEIQIGALRVYIFLAPLVQIMRALWTNATVLRGLKVIFVLLATPIAIIVGLVGAIVAGIVILGTIVSYVGGLIVGAFSYVVGAISGFVSALIKGGSSGATGFISGLVSGIKAGAGLVAGAVKDLAAGAVGSFTSFFQIKSPSRLMKAHGKQLPAGAAEGVDEGAVKLEQAMDGMWEMPRGRGRARASATGGRGKLADKIEIIFKGRADEFEEFRAKMEAWLDQQEAAGPEPEPST